MSPGRRNVMSTNEKRGEICSLGNTRKQHCVVRSVVDKKTRIILVKKFNQVDKINVICMPHT